MHANLWIGAADSAVVPVTGTFPLGMPASGWDAGVCMSAAPSGYSLAGAFHHQQQPMAVLEPCAPIATAGACSLPSLPFQFASAPHTLAPMQQLEGLGAHHGVSAQSTCGVSGGDAVAGLDMRGFPTGQQRYVMLPGLATGGSDGQGSAGGNDSAQSALCFPSGRADAVGLHHGGYRGVAKPDNQLESLISSFSTTTAPGPGNLDLPPADADDGHDLLAGDVWPLDLCHFSPEHDPARPHTIGELQQAPVAAVAAPATTAAGTLNTSVSPSTGTAAKAKAGPPNRGTVACSARQKPPNGTARVRLSLLSKRRKPSDVLGDEEGEPQLAATAAGGGEQRGNGVRHPPLRAAVPPSPKLQCLSSFVQEGPAGSADALHHPATEQDISEAGMVEPFSMDDDEAKRAKRMASNRDSARRSRRRKAELLDTLQLDVQRLRRQLHQAQERAARAEAELTALKDEDRAMRQQLVAAGLQPVCTPPGGRAVPSSACSGAARRAGNVDAQPPSTAGEGVLFGPIPTQPRSGSRRVGTPRAPSQASVPGGTNNDDDGGLLPNHQSSK